MTESELRDILIDAVMQIAVDGDIGEDIAAARSFADAGVMTRNEGIVLRMDDGSEFQLTIVRSR